MDNHTLAHMGLTEKEGESMSDNGELKEEKTPEQVEADKLQAKKDDMIANPDNYVATDDLLIAAMFGEDKTNPLLLVNTNAEYDELIRVQGYMTRKITARLDVYDMLKAKKAAADKVIKQPPKGGIMEFARRFKRK